MVLDHKEILDAALNKQDMKAQILLRQKLMYKLDPYHQMTNKKRIELLISFWEIIKNQEQRISDYYFASAVQYLHDSKELSSLIGSFIQKLNL